MRTHVVLLVLILICFSQVCNAKKKKYKEVKRKRCIDDNWVFIPEDDQLGRKYCYTVYNQTELKYNKANKFCVKKHQKAKLWTYDVFSYYRLIMGRFDVNDLPPSTTEWPFGGTGSTPPGGLPTTDWPDAWSTTTPDPNHVPEYYWTLDSKIKTTKETFCEVVDLNKYDFRIRDCDDTFFFGCQTKKITVVTKNKKWKPSKKEKKKWKRCTVRKKKYWCKRKQNNNNNK